MSDDKQFSGAMTTIDGKRVALTPEQAKAMWQQIEHEDAKRALALPSSLDCLKAMCSAEGRMKQLGWRDGRYCPRDGSAFAVCQVGSTGMWRGYWSDNGNKDKMAEGYIIAADCVHRPSEMYFKPLDKLTDEEAALVGKCDADVAVMIEQAGKAFEAMTAMVDKQKGAAG